MSIPVLTKLQDCAVYAKTVDPFIPQLKSLPHYVIKDHTTEGLKAIYIGVNPLMTGFAVSILLGYAFLVASEINKNYSQVDRLWSMLPNFYIYHMAAWARCVGLPTGRIDLVAIFSTLWSVRLTYNYWRRGGYEIGSEDYRWAIIRKQVPNIVFLILNITFISFIQSVLLFAFSCIPAYAILLASQFQPEVQPSDYVFFGILVLLVISEWFSDGQQYAYQTVKHQYYKDKIVPAGYKKEDLDRGFNTHGLWAYSRHPNFCAEQAIWLTLYQWSCFATENLYSYTGWGVTALVLLFQSSTMLTEWITSKKYPEYKEYQKQIGIFLPTSLRAYKPPGPKEPKIIRTSELEQRRLEKEEQEKEQEKEKQS